MEDTIFSKIIRREVPADIVYEDEHTLAFLDIAPVSIGHTLVVPKKKIKNIFDADDETLAHVMHTVRLLAPAIKDTTGADGLNIHSNHESAAGQVVFHLHFHLIPRFTGDNLNMWPHQKYDADEAQKMSEKIRSLLS